MCRRTYCEVMTPNKTSANRAFTWTPAGLGRGELAISDKRTHVTYSVTEFAVGRGFTGRAVRLAKRDGEVYCCRVGAGEHDHDCDCPGHAYGRGKTCKHVSAVRDIIAYGWLDLPFTRGDEPESNTDAGENAEERA